MVTIDDEGLSLWPDLGDEDTEYFGTSVLYSSDLSADFSRTFMRAESILLSADLFTK